MGTFVLRKISSLRGFQTFYKLYIDDKCQFDEFESSIKNNERLKNELAKIYAYMEFVANGVSLPSSKFKDITPKKQTVKEYEFKSRQLRLYAIKTSKGKIVVLCGYKNNQNRDIRTFRSIQKRYLALDCSIKSK